MFLKDLSLKFGNDLLVVYDGQFLEGNKVGVGVVMQPTAMRSAPTLSHAASSENLLVSRAASGSDSSRSARSLLIDQTVESPAAEPESSSSHTTAIGARKDSRWPSSAPMGVPPSVDEWKANRRKYMAGQMSSFRSEEISLASCWS